MRNAEGRKSIRYHRRQRQSKGAVMLMSADSESLASGVHRKLARSVLRGAFGKVLFSDSNSLGAYSTARTVREGAGYFANPPISYSKIKCVGVRMSIFSTNVLNISSSNSSSSESLLFSVSRISSNLCFNPSFDSITLSSSNLFFRTSSRSSDMLLYSSFVIIGP